MESDEQYKEYADTASWCNENNAVIVDYDDYYKVENSPEIPIDELKNEKLQELDAKASEYMLSKYPDYKQNNIAIFGTDAEKKEFQEYHDKMKEKYSQYRSEILAATTKEELDEVEIEF